MKVSCLCSSGVACGSKGSEKRLEVSLSWVIARPQELTAYNQDREGEDDHIEIGLRVE